MKLQDLYESSIEKFKKIFNSLNNSGDMLQIGQQIFERCAFCLETEKKNDLWGEIDCEICRCPPHICNSYAHHGLLGEIHREYTQANEQHKEPERNEITDIVKNIISNLKEAGREDE
jgi:hypothetical protein